jgi:hypothetical protein
MYAEYVKIGDRFIIEEGPITYKRVDTAFQAETVWSDLGLVRQEKQVVYAINDDWPERLHRFHPEQVVIPC